MKVLPRFILIINLFIGLIFNVEAQRNIETTNRGQKKSTEDVPANMKPINDFQNSTDEVWETYPLSGGEMTSIAIDPSNSNIVYVGSRDAGVFKTTDGGENWFAARDGLTFYPIRCLTIDPNNTDTIYAGTDFDGVWKSTDGGATWYFTNYPGEFIVFNIVIDPTDNSVLYASEAGGLGLGIGHVYKSTDYGETWQNVEDGFTIVAEYEEYINGIFSLAIDPSNPQVLYAGTNHTGVFKTENGGESWQSFNDSIPTLYGEDDYYPTINAFTISAQHPERPSALLDGKFYQYNGKYWELVVDEYVGESIDPAQLFFHPADSNKLFTNTHYSLDAGLTWTEYNNNEDCYWIGFSALTSPLQGENILYGAVANNNGVSVSSDNGVTWKNSSDGICATTVYSVAIDHKNPENIYTGTSEYFSYSHDAGETWNNAYSVEVYGETYYDTTYNIGEVSDIEIDPNDSSIIYVASLDFYRSDDQGKTLNKLESAGTPSFVEKIDHPNSNTLFVAGNGVGRSYDNGESWTALNTGLPTELGSLVDIKCLCLDPVDTSTLWVGMWHFEGIYKSTDGGNNWQSMGLTDDNYVSAIAVHPTDNNIIYAGGGYDEGKIFKSTNGGEDWTQIKGGVSLPRKIIFDPRDPDQIYVATEGWGILRSDDAGETWYSYDNGIFYPLHYSIDISETEQPVMVAGSYGSGIYHISPNYCSETLEITGQPEETVSCLGEDVEISITAEGDNLSYQWLKDDFIPVGENSPVLELIGVTLSDAGNYSCKVSNNCKSFVSNSVLLDVPDIDISVAQNDDYLAANSYENDTYQWMDCTSGELIDGEENMYFTPKSSGTYALIATINQCADTSECFVFQYTSIENSLSTDISIYPNPTSGTMSLSVPAINSAFSTLKVEISSVSGKVLERRILYPVNEIYVLDINEYSSGVYLIKVFSEELIYNNIIIKQ